MNVCARHELVRELTEEWMKLIGSEHHKDCDCHFEIVETWSYGDEPTYRVNHDGYIAGTQVRPLDCPLDSGPGYTTYDQALYALELLLLAMIEDYKR